MKLILITQGLSRVVLPLINSNHQVVAIIESAPRNYKQSTKRGLVWTIAKTFYHIFFKPSETLEQLCAKKSIPYKFMLSSNDEGLEEWIKNLKPDLIVVYSMSRLLKRNIFDIPKLGTINLHPSYLPDYRGANPCFWQYYNMEMQPGATVHYISDGEDDGDIIYQDRINIPLGIKSPQRLDKLIGELGVSLILRALDNIEKGNAPRIPQPKISPTLRARNLRPEEHASIIDWVNWNGEKIWHVLRGTELWLNALPQPTGVRSGLRWTVEEFIPTSQQQKKPGELFKKDGQYYVATRNGTIRLTCKPRIMSLVADFIRK